MREFMQEHRIEVFGARATLGVEEALGIRPMHCVGGRAIVGTATTLDDMRAGAGDDGVHCLEALGWVSVDSGSQPSTWSALKVVEYFRIRIISSSPCSLSSNRFVTCL